MRIVEILAALAAIGSIATFLGFRAMARKAVRALGRKPKPPEIEGRNMGTDVERRPPNP